MPLPSKIMLIRHAEKPSTDGSIGGVALDGTSNPDGLSVKGWQRAGALVQFFARPSPTRPGVERPAHLLASGQNAESPSVRALHTLVPLADYLGLPVHTDYFKGQEAQLAEAVQKLDGIVLIAWSHNFLPALGRALSGDDPSMPRVWDEDRFDLVWLLERQAHGWRFAQLPQLLLAGDDA